MVRIQIYFEDRLTDLPTDGRWERKVMVIDDSKVLGLSTWEVKDAVG